ncbi:hypothetical protein D3C84_1301550 [compost metagenome]
MQSFKDRSQLSAYALDAAALNVKYGIITGSNELIKPKQLLTRAETAAIIERLLQKSGLI